MTFAEATNGESSACLFETPIGVCGLAWTERGISRFLLPMRDQARMARHLGMAGSQSRPVPPLVIQRAIDAIRRCLSGEPTDLADILLDLDGIDAFRLQVYEATRALGWGESASYGEIASRIGEPRATRGVGQALGKNPIAVIIPCHRVLAKGHKLGGFSADGGIATKERLLRMEGVHVETKTPMLPGLFG